MYSLVLLCLPLVSTAILYFSYCIFKVARKKVFTPALSSPTAISIHIISVNAVGIAFVTLGLFPSPHHLGAGMGLWMEKG